MGPLEGHLAQSPSAQEALEKLTEARQMVGWVHSSQTTKPSKTKDSMLHQSMTSDLAPWWTSHKST